MRSRQFFSRQRVSGFKDSRVQGFECMEQSAAAFPSSVASKLLRRTGAVSYGKPSSAWRSRLRPFDRLGATASQVA
jgi:hypothetical protein